MHRAEVVGADLVVSDLVGADLVGADLVVSDLVVSDLVGADLVVLQARADAGMMVAPCDVTHENSRPKVTTMKRTTTTTATKTAKAAGTVPDSQVQSRRRRHPTGAGRVLLAEDDESMRTFLAHELRMARYEVVECGDGTELLEGLSGLFLPGEQREDYDLVVSDIRMPGFSGLQVLCGLQGFDIPPVILITAFGDLETHVQAERLGAAATLDKPFHMSELLDKAEEAIARRDHDRQRGWGW
jgi:CheY-like chemotaxis protein